MLYIQHYSLKKKSRLLFSVTVSYSEKKKGKKCLKGHKQGKTKDRVGYPKKMCLFDNLWLKFQDRSIQPL